MQFLWFTAAQTLNWFVRPRRRVPPPLRPMKLLDNGFYVLKSRVLIQSIFKVALRIDDRIIISSNILALVRISMLFLGGTT